MKRAIRIGIIVFASLAGLFLLGCILSGNWYSDKYEKLSYDCVNADEKLLTELYDIYNANAGIVLATNRARVDEIKEQLKNKYSISDINYYDDLKYMQFWFSPKFYDCEYAIVYYSPEAHEESMTREVYHKEKYIKLKNKFYFLIYTKGF